MDFSMDVGTEEAKYLLESLSTPNLTKLLANFDDKPTITEIKVSLAKLLIRGAYFLGTMDGKEELKTELRPLFKDVMKDAEGLNPKGPSYL